MHDMLVRLYQIPDQPKLDQDIQIRRAMAPDKFMVVDWVREHMGICAAGECDVSFSNWPISCFIASRGKEILGFACYDATALDFFGPTMVDEKERGKSLGKALLLACLHDMRAKGYGYAVIGGVGPADFYRRCVGATDIEDSDPGIYQDFLGGMD